MAISTPWPYPNDATADGVHHPRKLCSQWRLVKDTWHFSQTLFITIGTFPEYAREGWGTKKKNHLSRIRTRQLWSFWALRFATNGPPSRLCCAQNYLDCQFSFLSQLPERKNLKNSLRHAPGYIRFFFNKIRYNYFKLVHF